MVCTFNTIKQSQNSKNKRTSTLCNQHSFKKNVTVMTKNIRPLPSNEKTNGSKELVQTNRDTPFSLLPSNEIK